MEEGVAAPVVGDYGYPAGEKFSCGQKWIILVSVRAGFYLLLLGDTQGIRRANWDGGCLSLWHDRSGIGLEGELHVSLCDVLIDICGGATAGRAEKERAKL